MAQMGFLLIRLTCGRLHSVSVCESRCLWNNAANVSGNATTLQHLSLLAFVIQSRNNIYFCRRRATSMNTVFNQLLASLLINPTPGFSNLDYVSATCLFQSLNTTYNTMSLQTDPRSKSPEDVFLPLKGHNSRTRICIINIRSSTYHF